jgi:tetratricopeptide (TPR) repeat protein
MRMSEVVPLKYVAFLSYSHTDAAFGEAIHRELENYRIPRELIGQGGAHGPIPAKLRPIFRDRYDLEAGHSLRQQVTDAIANSQAMVVVCSPASAQSAYVNEEIRQFKALGRADRIYPIIIDGEPGDPDRECFPRALKLVVDEEGNITRFREEPIAADAREHADGPELARLKIISGLLGIDLDRLRRREAEDHKREKRFWIGISGAMAFLAVMALLATGFAWLQREEKREALLTTETLLDKTLARTSNLVSQAVSSVDRRGLPSQVGLNLLKEAQGYFDDMDEIKVKSKNLPLRRAEMLIGLSASYKQLGEGKKSLEYARRARDLLNEEAERMNSQGIRPSDEFYYQLAQSHINLARGQTDRGWTDFALASSRTGLKILDEHLGGIESTNPQWQGLRIDLFLQLANDHGKRWQWQEAFEYLDKCQQLGKRLGQMGLTGPAIRAQALALSKLAGFYRRRGNVEQAMAATIESEEMIRTAIKLHPDDLIWKARLHESLIIHGDVHYKATRYEEALKFYQESNEVVEAVHKRDPQNARNAGYYAQSQYKISEAANKLGKADLSEKTSARAVAVYESLKEIDPESQTFTGNLLHALETLGEAQRQLDKKEDMARTHEQRLKLAGALLKKEPEKWPWLRHAATAAFMAGDAYKMMKQPKRARDKFEIALGYYENWLQQAAKSDRIKFERAWTVLNIGFTYADQNDFSKALPLYQQAVAQMDPLMVSFPSDSYQQRRYIAAIESVAEGLTETGSPREGLEWFNKVIGLRRAMASSNPSYVNRRGLALAQEMIGTAWLKVGEKNKALELYKEGLKSRIAFQEEEPGDPQRRRNMANVQRLIAALWLDLGDCKKAHDGLSAAHENLAHAMAEHEEKTGVPETGWAEQLKEIEVLQAKAQAQCPRTSDATRTPRWRSVAAEGRAASP